MATKTIKLNDHIHFGGKHPFVLIAGPCVIESPQSAFKIAQVLQKITKKLGVAFVFKASYDKANRTSIHSFRGPGIVEGLRTLAHIKNKLGVPVLSDVADNASLASTANDRFAVRRAGNYALAAAARAVNSLADQGLFGVVLWKNGTSTLIGTNQMYVSGANITYNTWAMPAVPLAAGDTVNYQFQSSAGGRLLFASGYNSFFAGTEVL